MKIKRALLEEHHMRKVVYGGKVFRLTKRVTGMVVVVRSEEWAETTNTWLVTHYWTGLMK